MVEEITRAWRFIFNHHPRGDEIMTLVMEAPEQITTARFRKWFNEARGN
jgi:hypothetical protein